MNSSRVGAMSHCRHWLSSQSQILLLPFMAFEPSWRAAEAQYMLFHPLAGD
jgi:hypothetical protein